MRMLRGLSRRFTLTIPLVVLAAAATRAEIATESPDVVDASPQDAARLKSQADGLLARLDGAGPPGIWLVASKLGALGRGVAGPPDRARSRRAPVLRREERLSAGPLGSR